jgi:uncharacterized protein YdaL
MKTIESSFENSSLFTEYLAETFNNIQPFTAFNWLSYLDDDSLNMLSKYIDNFDEHVPLQNVNEDEAIDIFQLVEHIIYLETGKQKWGKDRPELIDCVQKFCAMIIFANLKRKGFIKVNGDGKLTDDNTIYELTDRGKAAHVELTKNFNCKNG